MLIIGIHIHVDYYLFIGGFEWIDGTSVGYTNWQDGEPGDDDGEGTNCVEMSVLNGKWSVARCEVSNGKMCKSYKCKNIQYNTILNRPKHLKTLL